MIEAKYWAGRASEANPELRDRPSVGDRLGKLDVNDITRAPSPTGWVSAGDEDDVRETEHILAELPGGLELIRWFGGQFGFHDAEIAALKLDREGPSCLEFFLPGRGQPTRVRFILTDWIDTSLNGFSHQNVIGDLILRRTKHRHIEPWERGVGLTAGQFEIELMPIFGAYGTIRASIDRVEIEAL